MIREQTTFCREKEKKGTFEVSAGARGLRQADLVSPSSAVCSRGHRCSGSHTAFWRTGMAPTPRAVQVTATEGPGAQHRLTFLHVCPPLPPIGPAVRLC